MTFFTDQAATSEPAARLATLLRQYLVAKGIPVNDRAVSNWTPQFKALASVRGESLVEELLRWYGPRCDDPYLPRIRSPKTLIDKWDRLLVCSGLETHELIISESVERLLTNRPLHWPFQPSGTITEAQWLQDAVNGIGEDMKRLPYRELNSLGPPVHVAGQWRLAINSMAFRIRPEGFEAIRYRHGDDIHFQKIKRTSR